MTICGVDVHDGYQAGLDFPTLYRQGYRFAAIKLTQGTGYVRDRADDWIRAARAAGLITGAYHWLTGADGAAQARWFFKQLMAAGGPDGMLIQLDVEDDGYGPQMTAWTREWNRLSGGYPFLIYSGAWWWPRTGGFRGADLTPYLWDSHYLGVDLDTVPDDPAALAARIPASWWLGRYGGWSRAALLQITAKGDAGGLGNNVDIDVYPGSIEQLRATFTRPGADMSYTDDVVKAIALGLLKTPDGQPVCPTLWQVANEKRFADLGGQLVGIRAMLDKLLQTAAQDPGNNLTAEKLDALRIAWEQQESATRDALREQLAAERQALVAAAAEAAHSGAEEGARGTVGEALRDAADAADTPHAG